MPLSISLCLHRQHLLLLLGDSTCSQISSCSRAVRHYARWRGKYRASSLRTQRLAIVLNSSCNTTPSPCFLLRPHLRPFSVVRSSTRSYLSWPPSDFPRTQALLSENTRLLTLILLTKTRSSWLDSPVSDRMLEDPETTPEGRPEGPRGRALHLLSW
ncbi:hypothetical protein C8Q72DRAFT_452390 [Fomitopsis betulina]|nr:hypothetical protein C8Q72DRAFT_452390 [Fomitopsis betulina]